MCSVNVTDFRNNISHYISLSKKENVQITKNGEIVAILSSPDNQYYEALFRLAGALKINEPIKDYKEMIGEEIMRKCGY